MNNELIIIRGIPGSGKSTFAKTFEGYVHLEADQYFMKDGIYQFNPKLLGKAHKWCQETCRLALLEGKNVVVSNTFTTHKEYRPYQDIATSPEINCVIRIWKCVGEFENVHGVPPEALQRMKDRWQDIPGEDVYNPLDKP